MVIGISPQTTRNFRGTFGVTWDGLMQGTAWPAPNAVFNLAGGYVAPTETDPMFGGMAISDSVPAQPGPPALPAVELGGPLIKALVFDPATPAAAGAITGFSVFDQDYAMINTPESPVPLADVYMQVNFYRMGSGARIAVAIDPALISLYGQIVTKAVGWDSSAQRLIAGTATNTLAVRVLRVQPSNCMTITYNGTAKSAAWNYNGAAAIIELLR